MGPTDASANGDQFPPRRRRDAHALRKAQRREARQKAKATPQQSRNSDRLRLTDQARRRRDAHTPWLPAAGDIFGVVSPDPGYVQFPAVEHPACSTAKPAAERALTSTAKRSRESSGVRPAAAAVERFLLMSILNTARGSIRRSGRRDAHVARSAPARHRWRCQHGGASVPGKAAGHGLHGDASQGLRLL